MVEDNSFSSKASKRKTTLPKDSGLACKTLTKGLSLATEFLSYENYKMLRLVICENGIES